MDPTRLAPKIQASKIPNVGLLFDSLGLPGLQFRKKSGAEAFRDFRRNYTTLDGRPGIHLRNWEEDYTELVQMAYKFINRAGWRYWTTTSRVRLPEDKDAISELLAQLFFQQNRNLWINEKGGHSKQKRTGSSRQPSSSGSVSSTGGSSEHPNRLMVRLPNKANRMPQGTSGSGSTTPKTMPEIIDVENDDCQILSPPLMATDTSMVSITSLNFFNCDFL
jgi:hypothetical protein